MARTPIRKTESSRPRLPSVISTATGIGAGILLHPGGGGAQYPLRFKPFRPRNLWRRTPGPRPPGRGSNGLMALIGLLVVVIVGGVIMTAITTGLFGLVSTKDADVEYVERAVEVGFQVERNIINSRFRTLNGEYHGIKASIVISRNNEPPRTSYPEVQRAVEWLELGTAWDALEVGRALVLCTPVLECSELASALFEAVSSS